MGRGSPHELPRFEEAGSWHGKIAPKPEPLPEQTSQRMAIANATKLFLDEMKETAAICHP